MQTVPRLYDIFQPTHYDLALVLRRPERAFSGSVTITGQSDHTDAVTLHAKDLTIQSVVVDGNPIDTYTLGTFDQLMITHPFKSGDHTITITFTGDITDAMHGVYPCYYEVDGSKQELLATQFESHHAREVFPCIDEPEAKASFDLTLTTEQDVEVLSNMPQRTQGVIGDALVTEFETTPRMSTYLLAFVIGELQKQSATTKSGVEVNVWSTKTHPVASLTFPLEVAVGCIDFFDEYFGVAYPLPKADHVALPDFSSGAMENWGLITYREIALLVDDRSSVSMREYVATVIAHETSHQWFGNLVTMKWWDDLWLNESFATIMEYVAVDALYPKWQTWNTFASQETLSALRRDQLAGVQAVKCEVNHPDEISTLFDPSIVYAKGGRLLKMLRSYIGEEAFRSGLQAYFKKYAYANTTGSDLWRAFSDSSGKDIESFMEAWIAQPGFPVVDLRRTKTGYSLSQEQFVIGAKPGDNLWPIPLFSPNSLFPELFDTKQQTVQADPHLPLLNEHNDAHFVTHYDDTSLQLVLEALQNGKLGPIDRLALLHETSLLARGGRVSTATLIPLLFAYQDEQHEPVWNIISMIVGDLKRFVEEDDTAEKNLKSVVQRLALPLYKKLGFEVNENESEQDTKLRAIILGLLAYAEFPEVIGACLDRLHNTADPLLLPSETRAILFSVAVKHGTDDDFERLLQLHISTQSPELRDDLASGLCAARTDERIQKLLSRLTDSEAVKQQDVFRWYIYLLRNRYARSLTWQWMREQWSWIEETFKGDKSYDDYARYSASVFSTRRWLETYTDFFTPMRSITALKRAIEIGTTEIEGRVTWLERDRNAVHTTLQKQTK